MTEEAKQVLNPVTLWKAIQKYAAATAVNDKKRAICAIQSIEDHIADWTWAYEDAVRIARLQLERTNRKPDVDKVMKWFQTLSPEKADILIEQLDETIHELFATQAEAVNNAGIEEQVKTVFEQCGDRAWDVLGATWDEWEFEVEHDGS